MEELLTSIRNALAADATPELRGAGVAACRTILAALEATPGEPYKAVGVVPDASAIASAVAALRGVPPDKLLDLAIAKLRAALPAGADVPAVKPLAFHLVPIPGPRR